MCRLKNLYNVKKEYYTVRLNETDDDIIELSDEPINTHYNYQCGECGEEFDTYDDSLLHYEKYKE